MAITITTNTATNIIRDSVTLNGELDNVIFRSNADIDDEDMVDISDWVDEDSGNGVSTQVTFDSKSCMKLDTGAVWGVVRRKKNIGSLTSRTVISFNVYFDALGTLGANDVMQFEVKNATQKCAINFGTDGLRVFNGSWVLIDGSLVIEDVWQEWSFDIQWGVTQTVDIYLNGELKYSDVDCTWVSAGEEGDIILEQRGYTTANRITYVDWFKAGSDVEKFEVWFEYWKDESGAIHYESTKEEKLINDTFDFNLSGLDNSTIYKFKAQGQKIGSGNPIYEGNILSFMTTKIIKFATDFRLKLNKLYKYVTQLDIVKRTLKKFITDLRLKGKISNKFYTNLRVIKTSSSFWGLEPKSLIDIIVKLDETELTDVDYNSLRIDFNLNRTPSKATFRLARHHDDLDYKLDGTSSEITNKNKIEIYDGTRKLFTGYITQIDSSSDSDTVGINAEDVRCKINIKSLDISYGHRNDYPSTKEAIEYVLDEINSLISGHDEVFFGFIPEPATIQNDCGALLDIFVKNSANINWYIDEEERLRFSKIGEGISKNLRLSDINERRHVYDIILNNITLNKMTDNYTQSYKIHLGKRYDYYWQRRRWNIGDAWWFPRSQYDEFAMFMFQDKPSSGIYGKYIGMNLPDIYSQQALLVGYTLKQYIIGQWLNPLGSLGSGKEYDLGTINVGSGEPVRELYLTNYGVRIENDKWEEITKDNGETWLVKIYGEQYNNINFAEDLANFELNQNNKLITEATITLLLDGYEYYNLSFQNLINIVNTTRDGIYEDNNGFPLNIDSISIDCSTRIVTLTLTNYGKTYFEKTISYGSGYRAETLVFHKKRVPQVIPGQIAS